MKKIVVKLDLQDDKAKQKAMRTVSALSGIDSISMDMKAKKLTVIGAVDPISIVTKLRKYWPTTDIILVGPTKESQEKPTKKKEEAAKKEEPKKAGGGGGEQKKEGKKEEEEKKPNVGVVPIYDDPVLEMVKAYKNPHTTSYYYVQSMEENPNACVIC